ncbi:fimbria/pilus periplasmic chaperone [Klebsiella aerogenes]|uniref:fimbria/pilus periplasmic chaperone n=1 Tax=Klebsiella aerogenes TaxID=548 RepID=UPI002DB6D769|nr:fimbria/pilus periplasmic chaperone [Klebsiella aerogenes]MEB5742696.1 fimbria/pilus periplasmic chaperone [Klebsiella aerogenes]HBV9912405.1 fimbria/pilus periplasmic chaperone [Klebsiella aerogenes]
MNKKRILTAGAGVVLCTLSTQALSAIALDRTRVIVEGGQKSVSLSVSNENKQLPYLAQGWIEDARGKKISSPLTVLPPVQRIEPGARSQVRLQTLPEISQLAQDRETLYYFNLREIPPRTNKPNTLQLALQTRIKLFFRPKSLIPAKSDAPWQEKITLTRSGERYQVNNPTPYYVTLAEGSDRPGGSPVKGFKPLMIEPRGQATLSAGVSELGNTPVLTYINDYGGRPQLKFTCSGSTCSASPVSAK